MKILDSRLNILPGMKRELDPESPSAAMGAASPQPSDTSPPWRSPAVLGSLLVLAFWFHGDSIVGVTLHLLHVFIEILEMGLEHLLEHLFHLEGHDAQLWTAWTGLGVFIALLALIYRWAQRRLSAKFQSRRDFVRWTRDVAMMHWPHWTPPLILLIVSASFF